MGFHLPHNFQTFAVTFPPRRLLRAAILSASLQPIAVSAQSDTVSQSVAPPAVTSGFGGPTRKLQLMAITAVGAATFNQTLGSPTGWSRTWGGYGRRLGDQIGFAAIEEGVRLSLGATVGWAPDTLPCLGRSTLRVRALVPRLGCAIRETAVLRNAQGRARPNFPLGVGALAAASASTIWRPDASTPAKALSLVATRVVVVLGATMMSHLVADWQNDRR